MMLARLKPYNGRTHVLRSYSVFGIKFLEARGWYQVEDDVAAYLKTVKQVESDEFSPAAFDVCTQEDALSLDEREKKQAERRAAEAANPTAKRVHHPTKATARRAPDTGALTTADLPVSDFDKASGSFDDDMAGKPEAIEGGLDGADDEADADLGATEAGPAPASDPHVPEATPQPKTGPKPRVGKPRG